MPYHNMIIGNQQFPQFRSDLINGLQALATMQSASTAPVVTYPYQLWADTSTTPATIRQRNGGNTAWIVIGTADTANWGLAALNGANFTNITVPTQALGTSTGAAASCGFVQAAISNNPSWINATLQNSWTSAAGYPACAYRKLPTNTVVCQGIATKASPTTGGPIFNLPSGFRPASTKRFVVMDSVPAIVEVSSAGDLFITYSSAGTPNVPSTGLIPLDVIRFEV